MTLTAHDIIEDKRPRLRDLIDMERDPPQATLTRDCTVRDAMRIIAEENRGGVVVLDETGNAVGIVSERDIVRNMCNSMTAAEVLGWKIERIMTANVIAFSEDTTCQTALTEMIDQNYRNMPVCDADGKHVACVEILQVANAKMAELTESYRKLMDWLALLNITENTVEPNACSTRIEAVLCVEGAQCVIVRDAVKNLGFITKDEFIRASHRFSGAHAC